MYKNIFSLLLLFVFVSDVYAACKPTKKTLTSQTGPGHDEYLYKNTREREKRYNNKKGDAFICGYVNEYDGCPVGETMRLRNAAVGDDSQINDAVFICSGGGDNYYWKTIIVESECTFSQPVDETYDDKLELFKVGDRYCEKVSDFQTTIFLNNAKKFLDELDRQLRPQNINLDINLSGYTANSRISGNDLFKKIKVEIESQEFSQAEKDFIINAINDSANKTNVNIDELESQLAGLQWNLTQTQAQLVLTQLIAKANQTNIADLKSQLESLRTQVNDNMTQEQVIELVVEKLNTRQFNSGEIQTIQTMLSDVVAGLGFTDERLQNQIDNLTSRVTDLETDVIDLNTENAKLKQLIIELKQTTGGQEAQINELFNKLDEVTSTAEFANRVQELIDDSNLNEQQVETVKIIIDSAMNDLRFTDQRLRYQINNLTSRVTDLETDMGQTKTELVKLKGYFAELKSLTGAQTQQIQQLFTELDKVTTTQEFKDKVQDIINSSYATDEFKTAVADVINDHDELKNMQIDLSMVKDTLYEHAEMIDENRIKLETARRNLEKADKELAKKYDNLYTQLMIYSANLGMGIQNLKWKDEKIDNALIKAQADLDDLCSRLSELDADKLDESAVQDLITSAIEEMQSELSSVDDELCADLNDQLNSINDIISRLDVVESKVNQMLADISAIQGLNSEQAVAIEQLKNSINNYSTPEDVYTWIMDNYNIFSNDQLEKIREIAEQYIDAKLSSFNARMNTMEQQHESERKILSAMSILNAFDASSKESVWRNKDGKFNTARLASDATAGVILGTAGGLISNKLIKKNQVKKGFENIGCYVGGQQIAEYGDEFTVGMN